jgi:hypothetical protein
MDKLKLPKNKAETKTDDEASSQVAPGKPDLVDRELSSEAPKEKPSKKKRVKLPKFISGWKLFRASLKDYKTNWKRYLLILGVVAVPANIISYIYSSSADQVASAYISFASIIMNVAFLWAITRGDKNGKLPGLREAYYDGSAAFVRFVLVSLVLVVMLIPAALGLALYTASLTAASYSGTNAGELALIGLIAVVLSIPSALLLVRYALAPIAAVYDDMRPFAALKLSRKFARKRYWVLLGRYAQLVVYLIIVSIPAVIVTSLLSYFGWIAIATVFFGIATTLVVLPLANRYLLNMFHELTAATSAPAQESTE